MNYETRVTLAGKTSRIKILPANPRTARGFSGDLILDEFAFHENSAAIWEAAEPILSANPDYLCRIASTPNGRHNMFYRLVTDPSITVRKVPRSEAFRQGLQIFHPTTRRPITPDEARALAHDKRAYDQNYECIFESENMTLLSHELISAAEDPSAGVICDDHWSPAALTLLNPNPNPSSPPNSSIRSPQSEFSNPYMVPFRIYALEPDPSETPPRVEIRAPHSALRNFWVGVDVGRSQDLTVISVLEKQADMFYVRALLRLRNLRLPQQQDLLEVACRSPRFVGAQIDMTGLGLGLYEYTHKKFGDRIRGLNFASTLPLGTDFQIRTPHSEIRNARAPEVLALRLLQVYESKRIRHPIDPLLREDLHKPERITTSEGRVSIAAARTESGHADHFWSLALAVDAALRRPEPYIHVVEGIRPPRIPRDRLIM
jgi:phage FluMu gp28-like protein